MILFLFFTLIIFIPICSGNNCRNKRTYGESCELFCNNCKTGCDDSGACLDGVCIIGFYGRGCRENNVFISQAPTLVATNCLVHVGTKTFDRMNTDIGSEFYYVVYGPYSPTPPHDHLKWPKNSIMTCTTSVCQTNVSITRGTHMFAIYFNFTDRRYSDTIQSLLSPVSNVTCNGAADITTSTTTLTSTTTMISTTVRATTSNPTSETYASSTTITESLPNTSQKMNKISTVSTEVSILPTVSRPISVIPTISSSSTEMITKITDNVVRSLMWSSKSSHFIYVTWMHPINVANIVNYTVSIQQNDMLLKTLSTHQSFVNITQLLSGNKYTITVTTNYGSSQSVGSSIFLCTALSPDIKVDNVQIPSFGRKFVNIVFPVDQTNYTCSTNVYRLAIAEVKSFKRIKRASSSKSGIPVGAIIKWNSTQLPTSILLESLHSYTHYRIYAEIYANINGSEFYYYSTTDQQTNGPTDGEIVGIVIGLILFILLLAILAAFVCWYRKSKQTETDKEYYDTDLNTMQCKGGDNNPQSFAYWSEISDKMEPRYLILNPNEWTDDLLKMEAMTFSNQNYAPDGFSFSDEFRSLPDDSSYSIEEAEANYTKNKRQDTIPYDHNRVKLRRLSLKCQSDYINASFIDGYLRKKAYIASQSPFDEDTTNDFWLMVFEQNVGQIVTLMDDDNTESLDYWPQLDSKCDMKEVMYGNISVKIINEKNYANYEIREFEIKDIGYILESQLVIQYQFHGWTRDGIPENSIAFLDFYQTIKMNADISNGPLLVHCETGVSPTAVYIAFDILNQQVIHENCVNVFRTVAQLRRSRCKVIPNIKQYMFIYDLLFESLLCGQFVVNVNVRRVYALLHRINPQTQIDYMHEQFYLLQTYHAITNCPSQNVGDLIFMDSVDCSKNISSIASPMNKPEKINQFWNTVVSNNIDVIVDLKTTDDKPYYTRNTSGNFHLSINEISTINECFTKFHVSLYNSRLNESIKISVYQLATDWVSDEDIGSEPDHNGRGVWVELIFHLLNNHSRDRILSLCSNGWSKSGLFLTCYNVASKMFRSKYVMVYNVVKSMKFYRYEFITSFDQYRFIYDFLKKWVDMKMMHEEFDLHSLPGIMPFSEKIFESLFTHEQMPVLRPEHKYALSGLRSKDCNYSNSDHEEDLIVVHYNIGTFSDLKV